MDLVDRKKRRNVYVSLLQTIAVVTTTMLYLSFCTLFISFQGTYLSVVTAGFLCQNCVPLPQTPRHSTPCREVMHNSGTFTRERRYSSHKSSATHAVLKPFTVVYNNQSTGLLFLLLFFFLGGGGRSWGGGGGSPGSTTQKKITLSVDMSAHVFQVDAVTGEVNRKTLIPSPRLIVSRPPLFNV